MRGISRHSAKLAAGVAVLASSKQVAHRRRTVGVTVLQEIRVERDAVGAGSGSGVGPSTASSPRPRGSGRSRPLRSRRSRSLFRSSAGRRSTIRCAERRRSVALHGRRVHAAVRDRLGYELALDQGISGDADRHLPRWPAKLRLRLRQFLCRYFRPRACRSAQGAGFRSLWREQSRWMVTT